MTNTSTIEIILTGLESKNKNIIGESTSFTMSDLIDLNMTSNDDPDILIEEYLKKEIVNFKSNRLGDSPIAKTLRLVEDICKEHIDNPILSSTDIFPYGKNSEVMIEVFLTPSDATEFTVLG